MDHHGACSCAECEELDLIETRQRSEAAALLGRRGGRPFPMWTFALE